MGGEMCRKIMEDIENGDFCRNKVYIHFTASV